MRAVSTTHAQTFRELHAPGKMLLLANVWDAGSARLIESCGAAAIATTSAGLAWSRGYPDGDLLPSRVLAAAIAEITRVLSVPLSADVEGGYSADPRARRGDAAAAERAGGAGAGKGRRVAESRRAARHFGIGDRADGIRFRASRGCGVPEGRKLRRNVRDARRLRRDERAAALRPSVFIPAARPTPPSRTPAAPQVEPALAADRGRAAAGCAPVARSRVSNGRASAHTGPAR